MTVTERNDSDDDNNEVDGVRKTLLCLLISN